MVSSSKTNGICLPFSIINISGYLEAKVRQVNAHYKIFVFPWGLSSTV